MFTQFIVINIVIYMSSLLILSIIVVFCLGGQGKTSGSFLSTLALDYCSALVHMVKESYNTDSYTLLCKQSLNHECRCPLILKRTFCSLRFVRSHFFISQFYSNISQCLVLAACIHILFILLYYYTLPVAGSLTLSHIMVWFC